MLYLNKFTEMVLDETKEALHVQMLYLNLAPITFDILLGLALHVQMLYLNKLPNLLFAVKLKALHVQMLYLN